MKKVLGVLLCLGACRAAPTFKGVKAARTDVEATVSSVSSGTIEAQQQAELGFTAVGRVRRINVHVGDHVTRGQILAELDNIDLLTIQNDAASELKRSQQLFASQLVAKVALDEARKNAEVARANYEKSIIRAPFDGVVTELNLQVGELVQSLSAGTQTGKALMRIIDLQPRIIKADVDEIDLAKVKVGQPARVKVLAARREPFPATVSRVVPFISTSKEQDRTSRIELHFVGNDAQVPVGASADVEVVVETKKGVLALPARVLFGTGGDRHVFKWDGSKLHKSPVQVGVGNYDRLEILSGVSEGDVAAQPRDDIEIRDGLRAKVEIQPWP